MKRRSLITIVAVITAVFQMAEGKAISFLGDNAEQVSEYVGRLSSLWPIRCHGGFQRACSFSRQTPR